MSITPAAVVSSREDAIIHHVLQTNTFIGHSRLHSITVAHRLHTANDCSTQMQFSDWTLSSVVNVIVSICSVDGFKATISQGIKFSLIFWDKSAWSTMKHTLTWRTQISSVKRGNLFSYFISGCIGSAFKVTPEVFSWD